MNAVALKKIYLTSSQDLLLCDETMANIRQQAQAGGYDELRKFILGEEADKAAMFAALSGASLFAAKTLVEVRVYTPELTGEQEKTIAALTAAVTENTMLSVGLPRLAAATRKKKWLTSLQKESGSLQILYPPQGSRYLAWLKRRAQKRSVSLSDEALRFLARNCEGDLNAADQELQKLALSYPPKQGAKPHFITYDEAYQAISDHSDYAVFALSDSALAGHPLRCRRILHRLRAEGIPPYQINWMLARDLRMLMDLATKKRISHQDLAAYAVFGPRRQKVQDAVHRFGSKTTVLTSLLRLAAMADRAAKGGEQENVWLLLEAIALRLAGQTSPAMLPLRLPD